MWHLINSKQTFWQENENVLLGRSKQKGIIHLTVTPVPMFLCTRVATSPPRQHICARGHVRTTEKGEHRQDSKNGMAALPIISLYL